MLHRDESVGINRLQVVGPDGDNIGGVEAMYVDEGTNEPEFALVGVGFFRLRHSFVPMEGARTEGDSLYVRYSKDMVKDAPYLQPEERLDDHAASVLYEHYGIEGPARPTEAEPAAPRRLERAPGGDSGTEPFAATDEQGAAEPSPVSAGPSHDLEARHSREATDERPASSDTAAGGDAQPPAAPDTAVDEDVGEPARTGEQPEGAPLVSAQEKDGPDEAPTDDEAGTSLEDRTVDELHQMASDRDIPGRSSMNKAQLVDALSRGHGEESRSGSDRAYEDWTVDELRQLAADRDISGRSSMNKGDLIDALRGG